MRTTKEIWEKHFGNKPLVDIRETENFWEELNQEIIQNDKSICSNCGHSVEIHTEGGPSGYTCNAGDCYCCKKRSELTYPETEYNRT